MLLRLVALLNFRPSFKGLTAFNRKRLRSENKPTHRMPEVLNSLTGLERVGP